jgi:hypothetical protein
MGPKKLIMLNMLKIFPRKPAPVYILRVYTNSANDVFKVLEENDEEEVGFEQWLSNTKETFKTSKGRFWLGKRNVLSISIVLLLNF